jgi:chaperonin GroES
MGVRPLSDRVLVERLEESEQKSAGGIIIPDTAKEKPQRGKIIAIGAGKVGDDGKRIPMDIEVGQEVLFGKYAGQDIKIDDKEMMIMREDDIVGIIE